jgi:hypothetical protein
MITGLLLVFGVSPSQVLDEVIADRGSANADELLLMVFEDVN